MKNFIIIISLISGFSTFASEKFEAKDTQDGLRLTILGQKSLCKSANLKATKKAMNKCVAKGYLESECLYQGENENQIKDETITKVLPTGLGIDSWIDVAETGFCSIGVTVVGEKTIHNEADEVKADNSRREDLRVVKDHKNLLEREIDKSNSMSM